MKLTIIGFWGAYPGPGEASSAYLVEEDDEKILLDCGSGVLSILQNYTAIENLNCIVLSHYHPDHIADIGCIQHAAIVQKSLGERTVPVSIYGHDLSDYFQTLSYKDVVVGKVFSQDSRLEIGPFSLSFLRTPHPIPAFAIRVEAKGFSIGYTGDTGWSDALPDFFKDVDLLVSEASLYNRFKGRISGHLTSGEAGRLAEESGAEQLLLTHLPHYGNHQDLVAEAALEFGGRILLAKTGITWHNR